MRVLAKPIKMTRQGAATRQAILTAAERHFADQGFTATRLEDVAASVDIRAATLLYYFPSKQALYDEVDKTLYLDFEREIEETVTESDDPLIQLTNLADSWLNFLYLRPTAAKIFQRNIAGETMNHPPREFHGRSTSSFRDLILKGQSSSKFKNINPYHVLHIVGGSILSFICIEQTVRPNADDNLVSRESLEEFRATLHRVIRLLLGDLPNAS